MKNNKLMAHVLGHLYFNTHDVDLKASRDRARVALEREALAWAETMRVTEEDLRVLDKMGSKPVHVNYVSLPALKVPPKRNDVIEESRCLRGDINFCARSKSNGGYNLPLSNLPQFISFVLGHGVSLLQHIELKAELYDNFRIALPKPLPTLPYGWDRERNEHSKSTSAVDGISIYESAFMIRNIQHPLRTADNTLVGTTFKWPSCLPRTFSAALDIYYVAAEAYYADLESRLKVAQAVVLNSKTAKDLMKVWPEITPIVETVIGEERSLPVVLNVTASQLEELRAKTNP